LPDLLGAGELSVEATFFGTPIAAKQAETTIESNYLKSLSSQTIIYSNGKQSQTFIWSRSMKLNSLNALQTQLQEFSKRRAKGVIRKLNSENPGNSGNSKHPFKPIADLRLRLSHFDNPDLEPIALTDPQTSENIKGKAYDKFLTQYEAKYETWLAAQAVPPVDTQDPIVVAPEDDPPTDPPVTPEAVSNITPLIFTPPTILEAPADQTAPKETSDNLNTLA
jgi:hypothetical protein